MKKFEKNVSARLRGIKAKKGQGYVEYILIIGLVGLVTTAALITFQTQIATALGNIGTSLAAD